MAPARPIPVALLGATGAVGQRALELLRDHPWFRLVEVVASPRHAGRRLGDVLVEPGAWLLDDRPDPRATVGAAQGLELLGPDASLAAPLVLSALPAAAAGALERRLADAGHLVVTNASANRSAPAVPLVVPEVNAAALDPLVAAHRGGARGAILANPNCTTAGLALVLAPLARAFGLEAVHLVTMQALSGAGRAGLAPPRLSNDLVPSIAGEEEKVEAESRALLDLPELAVSATCTRVPVVDGHTLVCSVRLSRRAERAELERALADFVGEPQRLGLPSAPARPVRLHPDVDAPRPSRHLLPDGGMATHVGRLRPCPILHWRFVALSHNTRRGAAGGALLLAELAAARGLVGG